MSVIHIKNLDKFNKDTLKYSFDLAEVITSRPNPFVFSIKEEYALHVASVCIDKLTRVKLTAQGRKRHRCFR